MVISYRHFGTYWSPLQGGSIHKGVILDNKFMPTLRCWSRCRAPHKEAHNMTNNEQSDSSQFPVSQHIEENNWHSLRLLIEPESCCSCMHAHTQPHHKHINISRNDLQTCLFHRNTCSNQIHSIQIANKMHFNVYDVFYSLSSHQYVQGDTSIITRLQKYKCCVALPPLHHN